MALQPLEEEAIFVCVNDPRNLSAWLTTQENLTALDVSNQLPSIDVDYTDVFTIDSKGQLRVLSTRSGQLPQWVMGDAWNVATIVAAMHGFQMPSRQF